MDPGQALSPLFKTWINNERESLQEKLFEYLSIPTVTPDEVNAFAFLEGLLSEIHATSERVKFPDTLEVHPLRSRHPSAKCSTDCLNLRGYLPSPTTNAKTVLFNAHVDVVPVESGGKSSFAPFIDRGRLFARGSCDTKGNTIMLLEAVRFMQECNVPLKKNVLFDLVTQEEIGGNGALASVLSGVKASGAICLEPTNLQIFHGHRGCITLDITIRGVSVHMGEDSHGLSAIDLAFVVVSELKKLEERWIKLARELESYKGQSRPIQINVGTINGGEWHGSVPSSCTLGVNVGFPPVIPIETVQDEVMKQIESNDALKNTEVAVRASGILNDAYLSPKTGWLVEQLENAVKTTDSEKHKPPASWQVSCDARLYSKIAELPTVIFGCGSLSDAHTADESLDLSELETGMLCLAQFLSSE